MSGTRERPTAVGQPKSKHPLSARVVGSAARLSPDGSEFTAYVVTASHADGRTWNLYKRFSDFVAVRDWLVQEPDFSVFVSELPFPSKKLWGTLSKDVVSSRQLELDSWLSQLVQAVGVDSPALCGFIIGDSTQNPLGRLPAAGSVSFNMSLVVNPQPFSSIYTSHGELGRGAFSVVYLCVNNATGGKFACKVVDMTSPEYLPHEMEMEIRVAKLVSGHPNTVNIVDVFRDDRYWYLVQELVMGGELFEIVIRRSEANEARFGDSRPYSEQQASLVVQQIVAAVAHCHSKGVVHRDLKPENLLCVSDAPDSVLKLGDFGLSTLVPRDGEKLMVSAGTPEYVAPEVITQPAVGYVESCDVWGIGVIMYILLCGFPPFYGSTPQEILLQVRGKKIENSDAFFPPEEWSSISVEAKTLILAMLSRDPARRPAAAEVLEHPWITSNAHTVAIPAIKRMKRFNAKRKFRAAIFALKATNRMQALIKSMRVTNMAVKFALVYSLEHVEMLYDEFEELAERQGMQDSHMLSRHDFLEVLDRTLDLGGDGSLTTAHFEAFSVDGLGLNYLEYILALSSMYARTADETLKFAFEIIDADGSGQIEQPEFCHLMRAMMARTQQHLDADSVQEVSEREFAAADINSDGVLSVAEFVEAGKQQLQLRRYFSSLDRLCRSIET